MWICANDGTRCSFGIKKRSAKKERILFSCFYIMKVKHIILKKDFITLMI